MTAGIYYILNTKTHHIYIGSSVNVERRLSHHRSELRGGVHTNKRMQAAWNEDGEAVFDFALLVEVHPVDGHDFAQLLWTHEVFWIGFYHSKMEIHGYNRGNPAREPLNAVFDTARALWRAGWERLLRERARTGDARERAQSYYVELPPYRRSA